MDLSPCLKTVLIKLPVHAVIQPSISAEVLGGSFVAVGGATENKLCVGGKEGRAARHILTSSCCRLKPSVINAILKEPEASFHLYFHPSSPPP